MLTYTELKEKSKGFLAATGLKVEEFEYLLPVFSQKYSDLFNPKLRACLRIEFSWRFGLFSGKKISQIGIS